MPQSKAVERLPRYLKNYCVPQDYSQYTAREHATWRYIMRQNRAFFKSHAVDAYLDGLAKTGIPIDRIPNIDEMDRCLNQFGYGAVGVVGFIPPAIFLEFQANGIMPIGTDMRTLEHLEYTPAPDIVHEAAGHAPIVADPDYRAYLKLYGTLATRAIFSSEDVRLYEAIRYLSDIKENPDARPNQIQQAQERLTHQMNAMTYVSESAQVARMGWWTIEYGLVGKPNDLKIYGAGLLSSVGESQACLRDRVKKVPLTLKCIEQSYDITEPQPQLFYAPTLKDLPPVLVELEATLGYYHGGVVGLNKAKRAATVNTIQLDSGLQIGGQLESFMALGDSVIFLKLAGPCQLGIAERELEGHGRACHSQGYSTPLGRFRAYPDIDPVQLSDKQLEFMGVRVGSETRIEYRSGFLVTGYVKNVIRKDGRLLLIQLDGCSVIYDGRRYYEPEWGVFDLAIGEHVQSVYSGPPDRDAYGIYDIGSAKTSPHRETPYSNQEKDLFSAYQKLRNFRQSETPKTQENLRSLIDNTLKNHPDEWLLHLELLEIAEQWGNADQRSRNDLRDHLKSYSTRAEPSIQSLVNRGIDLAKIAD